MRSQRERPSADGYDPGPEPPVEPSGDAGVGARARVVAARHRVDDTAAQLTRWFEQRRTEALPFDLAAAYYERDRDSFASVLGAALAMRLFLFLVPFIAVLVGGVIVIFGSDGIEAALDGASVAGSMAAQIRDASDTSRTGGLAVLASGLVLSLWAGRSLTRVLAACSAGAWRITGRESRATLRMAGTVTALVALLLATTAFINRVREQFDLPLATTSWFATAALVSVAWFAVTWSLPRGTRDPGTLLPGALLTGICLTGLQWVMQYYLPGRIERASELTGSMGLTLAALGYLFLVGRLMASSLILNAVIFERIGSISGLVFGLPGLNRLPRRSPRLARFFDLPAPPAGRDDASGDEA